MAFVIPARNAERTLRETIQGALAQDERSLEVVVVDDASEDGTRDVASSCRAVDDRVRLLADGKRRGVAASRNLGVSASRARYLCFLDADDLVPPEKVRVQAAFLDGNPATSIAYSPAVQFTDGIPESQEPVAMAEEPGGIRRSLLSGGVAFPPHCAMLRRGCFDAVGGFDPEHFHQIEDTFLWLKLALKGFEFTFLPMAPVKYRRHPGARSADREMVLEARIAMTEWLARQCKERSDLDSRSLAQRRRYLTLILAEVLAQGGKVAPARRKAMSLLRTDWRPGEALEVLRFVLRPRRRRWTETSPEVSDSKRRDPPAP